MTQISGSNRFLTLKQNTSKKQSSLLTAFLCVFFLPSLNPLYAQGVAAGIDISNTAVVSYQIGGIAQAPLNSPPAVFKVDRKIDLSLTGDNNANVTPGDLQAEVTYTLVNEGNDIQEFSLIPDTSLISDNFDINNCNTIVTAISGTPLSSLPATGNIKLNADQQANVSVKCDVPLDNAGSPILNGHTSLLSLHATAEKNNDGSNVAETYTADTAMGIETVFADGAGLDDANHDASFTARRTYTVTTALQAPIAINDTQANTGIPSPTNPTVLAKVTENDSDSDGTINVTSIDLDPSLNGVQNTLTNTDGNWVVDTLGNVTFTPNATLSSSPAPISYTVKDNHGLVSNEAKLTVTYGQGPTAFDDSKINLGVQATANPTTIPTVASNDTDPNGNNTLDFATIDLNPALAGIQTTRNIPLQGTWTVNANGDVTFTPMATTNNQPSPITYTIKDNDGNISNEAALTITYGIAPVTLQDEKAVTSAVHPSNPITLNNILANDSDADGTIDADSIDLDVNTSGIQSSITTGNGTWQVGSNGDVIFTPIFTNGSFIGTPSNIIIWYTVNDNHGNTSNKSQLIVRYGTAPIANNDSQTNNGVPSPSNPTVLTDISANDNDTDGSLDLASIDLNPATTGIQQTLSNSDGVWSVNGTGAVTFTPNATLVKSPAPISYTINDNHGNISNQALLTVSYGHLPVAVNDTSIDHVIGTSVTINPLLNDTDPDGNNALDPSTVVLIGSGVSTDGKTKNVIGEGVWTVNTTSGEITFTPESGYTGDPATVSYTVKNNSGNTSNPAVISIDYKQITTTAELTINKTIVGTIDPEGGNKAVSGAVVTYKITISTTGTGIVNNTIITDPTPSGMTYKIGSIRLNNKNLTDVINLTDDDDSDNADFGITHSNTATINLGDITAGSQNEILLSYTIN